jgi:hypothetical protein
MIQHCPNDEEVLWQWGYAITQPAAASLSTQYTLLKNGGVGDVWAASASDLLLWLEGVGPEHSILAADGTVVIEGRCGLLWAAVDQS